MWYYLFKINESYEVALYELIAIPSHSDSWNEKEIFMILLNYLLLSTSSPHILEMIQMCIPIHKCLYGMDHQDRET